jgi:importin-7
MIQDSDIFNSLDPVNIPNLLAVSLSDDALNVRQLAAINLKNIIRVLTESKQSALSGVKFYIQQNIFGLLRPSVPLPVRLQFEEICYSVLVTEFPWDGLIASMRDCLNGTYDDIYSGIMVICIISKIYRANSYEFLYDLVSGLLSRITFVTLALARQGFDQTLDLLFAILKIYWNFLNTKALPQQKSEPEVCSWAEVFRSLLESASNCETLVKDLESKVKTLKCKCLKLCTKIIYKYSYSYIHPSALKDPNSTIGSYYVANWSAIFLDISLRFVSTAVHCPLTDCIVNIYFKLIILGFQNAVTRKVLIGKSPDLLEFVMKFLARTDYDAEIWDINPAEFVRYDLDVGSFSYHPKTSGVNLISTICEVISVGRVLEIIVFNLKSFNFILKEAFLYVLGSIADVIMSKYEDLDTIEDLIIAQCSPELTSPIDFLRFRACWVYYKFSGFQYNKPGHQDFVFQQLCRLIIDTEIPVKVIAAITIPRLLTVETCYLIPGSDIIEMFRIYFDIISGIETEYVSEALEELLEMYSDHVIRIAEEFSSKLGEIFIKISTTRVSNSNAESCVFNIFNKLLEIIGKNEKQVISVSYGLEPVFNFVINSQTTEYFQDLSLLYKSLTYYNNGKQLPNFIKYLQAISLQ